MSRTDDGWGPLRPETRAEYDPYDIIPDDFEHNSIHEARAVVEDGFGDPHREQPVCPECGTPEIHHKPGAATATPSNRRDGEYRCKGCGHHFDTPEQSPEAAAPGRQGDLGGFDA